MKKLGIIGCGYWGPNLLRNFNGLSTCEVKIVCDLEDDRLNYVKENYPSINRTKDINDVFNSDIDAVVIATPARTHFALAKKFLEKGIHIFVEKPLAMSVKESEELLSLACKQSCLVMVGHTFEFNPAVCALKQYVKQRTIGKPYYLYSQRLNLGIVRQDINALWNLAPHDISILIYILEAMPIEVSANGVDFIQKGIEDVVFMTLRFPEDILAHIQVSWLDPNKVRQMTVVGSDKMIVYDDGSDAKIKIYDKGIKKQNISDSLGAYDDFGKFQLIKHAGDVSIPKIDFVEPLKIMCSHFIDCLVNNKKPLTDGENGLRVVKVLEAAQKSISQNGKNIIIK